MPLTPEDVSNKRFTPVRLREGYDMGEVDQFLDEVEAELARLTKENDDLRTKLSSVQTGGSSNQDNTAQTPAVQDRAPEPEPTPEPTPQPVAAPEPEVVRVETVPQASNAAARLLEIAVTRDQRHPGAGGVGRLHRRLESPPAVRPVTPDPAGPQPAGPQPAGLSRGPPQPAGSTRSGRAATEKANPTTAAPSATRIACRTVTWSASRPISGGPPRNAV